MGALVAVLGFMISTSERLAGTARHQGRGLKKSPPGGRIIKPYLYSDGDSLQVRVDMPEGVNRQFMREIGQAITDARKARRMTQSELGERVRKSTNAVSNWERGASAPTVESLRELCAVLDVTPAHLMGIAGNRDRAPRESTAFRRAVELDRRIGALRRDAEDSIPSLIDALDKLKLEAKRLQTSLKPRP